MKILAGVKKKLVRVLKKPLQATVSVPLLTLADAESLTMPPVQVIVVRADMGCFHCQKRVADFISRLDETTSMVVDVLEKKVTLSGRGPAMKGFNKQLDSIQPYRGRNSETSVKKNQAPLLLSSN
ncbi:hypothetical protein H6P81_002942 [Aristolochia fimbriata]|uniref:HMA domain-containing protein n=1 Tax=Aristolochia fimbriata TaxID=158543 RepID=A0AAV7FCW0_ARIFI|nr:hypothetical protein H6P81_002942 [Aristolochia fimbriata]